MTQPDLFQQILDTWGCHNDILLFLVNEIPEEGLLAVPGNSRGRGMSFISMMVSIEIL